jgi:hypothetical protein
VGDLARRRDALDAREADPLDVPDHGDAHDGSLPCYPYDGNPGISQATGIVRFTG